MSSLVGGIVTDAQQLIRQELLLARREIQQEVAKVKTAIVSLAAGAFCAVLGVILLSVMVALLISWLTGDRCPLWASFGIVGGILAILGVLMLVAARNKASDIHLVPPQTAETMRENVQWIKNQT
jgi:CHASE3 domain sensor protein